MRCIVKLYIVAKHHGMKRGIIFTLGWIVLLSGCANDTVEPVYVGTSSNMQQAMVELVKVFERETGINAEIISGSSGKLSAQIEQGHPIDVFVSADMQYPMHLYRSDYAVEKPRIYAYGELAIVAIPGVTPDFESMLTEAVHQIAVANPKTAPYGVAAATALRNAGVLDSVGSKLVYGTSISQTMQFVDAKAAEIGITAKSLVSAGDVANRNWQDVPKALYTPLAQGVLLVKRNDNNEKDARAFFEFMTSDAARAVLESNGYSLPPKR